VAFGYKSQGEHAIRRSDIVFQDSSDRRFNIPQYFQFLSELKIENDRAAILARVDGMLIYLHSSKVRKKMGRLEFLGRRSEEESMFLGEMVLWCLLDSGLGCFKDPPVSLREKEFLPDELFFARRHSKGIGRRQYFGQLYRNDVVEATKEGAKRLGLDPRCFSSHSWKIASITDMVKQGESDATVRRLGDHAVNSASTFLYQREGFLENRPLVLASSGKGLTVADINIICPLNETPFESIKSDWLGNSIVSFEDESQCIQNDDSDGSDISDNDYSF
jgi:hypothetical protein